LQKDHSEDTGRQHGSKGIFVIREVRVRYLEPSNIHHHLQICHISDTAGKEEKEKTQFFLIQPQLPAYHRRSQTNPDGAYVFKHPEIIVARNNQQKKNNHCKKNDNTANDNPRSKKRLYIQTHNKENGKNLQDIVRKYRTRLHAKRPACINDIRMRSICKQKNQVKQYQIPQTPPKQTHAIITYDYGSLYFR
jgi:hypothetical protein